MQMAQRMPIDGADASKHDASKHDGRADESIESTVVLSGGERDYLKTLPPKHRGKQMRALKSALAVRSSEPLRFRIVNSQLPQKVQAEILARLSSNDGCSAKYEAWVEKALQLPLMRFTPPLSTEVPIASFLRSSRKLMDEAMWGQHRVKDEVIRMLCQFASSGSSRPFALGLVGAAGVGKTALVQRALAPALKRPFSLIALGGASDASTLCGHSYTYEGSQSGRIADTLIDNGTMDGVIFFDELDKVADTPKGHEIVNTLIHMTDPSQNARCALDRYFAGIELDFSRSPLVFSYNNERLIDPVLLNRLNVIRFDPPTVDDKLQIARRHLIPRSIAAAGMSTEGSLAFPDAVLRAIVSHATVAQDVGVRSLERAIDRIVLTCNVLANGGGAHLQARGDGMPETISMPYTLTERVALACLETENTQSAPPSMMYC
jgi:ATP-dependent Lon protease